MTVSEIRQLFDYTEWANDLVLDAAQKLTSDQLLQDVGISHRSILGTMALMAGAEWVWLERWNGRSPTGDQVWTPWTTALIKDIPGLRGKWQSIADTRNRYLEKLTDAELPRALSFRRINGDAGSMPLVHQMQHVVNHATLHRGQTVGMIRQLGIAPPATDLLFYWMTR
jgi:uncharacterized damage-inducible protein DinB